MDNGVSPIDTVLAGQDRVLVSLMVKIKYPEKREASIESKLII